MNTTKQYNRYGLEFNSLSSNRSLFRVFVLVDELLLELQDSVLGPLDQPTIFAGVVVLDLIVLQLVRVFLSHAQNDIDPTVVVDV